MILPVIVVLEDCRERMHWLRETFRGEAQIVWTWRVSGLLDALDEHGPMVRCVILDHDIPPPDSDEIEDAPWVQNNSQDAEGKTGYDACLEMPIVDMPILVWSVNGPGRERMIRTLRERGMRAEPMPHLQVYYDRIESFVRDAICTEMANG